MRSINSDDTLWDAIGGNEDGFKNNTSCCFYWIVGCWF